LSNGLTKSGFIRKQRPPALSKPGIKRHAADDKKSWRLQQMLVDPEGDNDWVAEFEVDLAESRKSGELFLRLRRIGSPT